MPALACLKRGKRENIWKMSSKEQTDLGKKQAEKPHEWKLQDDMLALYLYKVEQENKINLTQKDIDELALAFGISVANMRASMENYKQLDGKGGLAGGLPGAPEQARQVWDAYWDLSAESIMERLTGRK